MTAREMSLPIWAARVEVAMCREADDGGFHLRFDGQQDRGGENQPGHEALEGCCIGLQEQPATQ